MRWPDWRLMAFLALVFFAIFIATQFFLRADDDDVDRVETTEQAWSVQDVFNANLAEPQAVTGFVHDDGFPEPRLCNGRQEGDPPLCVGPYLSLDGLDPARLEWDEADEPGVRWSREAVTVLGMVTPDGRLRVSEILS